MASPNDNQSKESPTPGGIASSAALAVPWRLLPHAVIGHFGTGWTVLWSIIGGAAILCILGCIGLGIAIAPGSILKQCGLLLMVLLLGAWYTLRGRAPALADLANATGTLLVVTAVGATLSYLGMALGFAYVDSSLAAFDSHIGFDWTAFNRRITSIPTLELTLGLLYVTSAPQVLLLVLLLAFSRRRERLAELVGMLALSAFLCVGIGSLAPALGAHATYGVPDFGRAGYVAELEAVRHGQLRLLDFDKMTGLVTFPSLHTAISLIAIWVTRSWRPVMIGSLIINIPLLTGVPVFGSHYIADMLGGAALTVLAGIGWRFVSVSGVAPTLLRK